MICAHCNSVNQNKSVYCKNCGKNNLVENNYYLFFDTETTGLPRNRNAPYKDTTNWPRIVQIAWILCDDKGRIITSEEHIIKPEGFIIPFDAQNLHGISNEKANSIGEDLSLVLNRFSEALCISTYLIAHNLDFDLNVLGAEFVRKGIESRLDTIKKICTMKATVEYCRIPRGRYGFKWPSLMELHYNLFKTTFHEKHDALYDVRICVECFFELKRRGII